MHQRNPNYRTFDVNLRTKLIHKCVRVEMAVSNSNLRKIISAFESNCGLDLDYLPHRAYQNEQQ